MILRFLVSKCTSITCLSERGNPRDLQASRYHDVPKLRLWSRPMSKPIHNEEKVVVAHKKALGDKARDPTSDGCLSGDNRRLAWHRVSGLFDRFLIDVKPQISCWLLLNRCDIFTTCVTPVIIRGDRCAVEIDTTISPLLWRVKQALCETTLALPPSGPISRVERFF